MASFPQITQTGRMRWTCFGGNISNHETFAFRLAVAQLNVGAKIADVTVFIGRNNFQGQVSYDITLDAVDTNGNLSSFPITGGFESQTV